MRSSYWQNLFTLLRDELKLTEEKEVGVILRVIIVEKFIKGIVLFLLSLSFFPVFSDDVVEFLHGLAHRYYFFSNARFFTQTVDQIEGFSDKKLIILSFFFLLWGLVELAESIGLNKKRRWAEYLAVVSNSLFIPIEFSTLLMRFTLERLLLLIFNIFLVYYLIWSRNLFTTQELRHIRQAKKSHSS